MCCVIYIYVRPTLPASCIWDGQCQKGIFIRCMHSACVWIAVAHEFANATIPFHHQMLHIQTYRNALPVPFPSLACGAAPPSLSQLLSGETRAFHRHCDGNLHNVVYKDVPIWSSAGKWLTKTRIIPNIHFILCKFFLVGKLVAVMAAEYWWWWWLRPVLLFGKKAKNRYLRQTVVQIGIEISRWSPCAAQTTKLFWCEKAKHTVKIWMLFANHKNKTAIADAITNLIQLREVLCVVNRKSFGLVEFVCKCWVYYSCMFGRAFGGEKSVWSSSRAWLRFWRSQFNVQQYERAMFQEQ